MKTVCAIVVALAFVGSAVADTINVPAGGDIQAAINGASDGDIIQLEAGEYFPTATLNTYGKAVSLIGTTDPKTGAPTSIIDGQDSIRVLQCDQGVGADTVFENLLITGGYTSGDGGGMRCEWSYPTLENCTFAGNSATGTYGGGGMYIKSYSSPTLIGCTFTGNSATTGNWNHGGGMFNSQSNPTLIDCTFTNNSADGIGGGMYNYADSSPMLTDTTLCGNSPDQVYGGWTDNGGNCLLFSCADDDGDGVPDKCGGRGGAILLVPSEYPTIESAIAAAAYGDVIEIAAGTYQPAETLNTQGKPITLRGAIDGDGQPATIIDGQDSIQVLICDSGETTQTVFENLLITGGYAPSQYQGGGMYCVYSSPTLYNCTFEGNASEQNGGGMANHHNSSPTLTDCTFEGNSAYYNGGGMYNSYTSSPTLTDCTFTNNQSAGMCNYDSSPMLVNCTFDENQGGMVNSTCSSPTLTGCTFTGNSADSNGGGMLNYTESSPTLTNCTFTNNSADMGGGMATYDFSIPTLVNCTFTGNSANTGGGMWNSYYGSPTLVNCTFEGNSASGSNPGGGGGIYNDVNNIMTLTDTAVCNNTPDQIQGNWTDNGGNCISESCRPDCWCENDQDGDGVCDEDDGCPNDPNKFDPGQCGCGVPDTDSDGDGVADCLECPGDITANGIVDAADLGILLAVWGTDGKTTPDADVNNDGNVDGGDLGLLILYWGPCP